MIKHLPLDRIDFALPPEAAAKQYHYDINRLFNSLR